MSASECPTCGKVCYPSRRTAKKVAIKAHPKDRLNAYRCGPSWHIGHVPQKPRRPQHAPSRRI